VRIVASPVAGLVDRLISIERLQIFGRNADSVGSINIDDDRVSTNHLALYPDESHQLAWRDTGSKNGTFVNGVRGVSGTLVDNDVVRIGSTLMVVTHAAPVAALALAEPEHDLVGCAPRFLAALELARVASKGGVAVLLLGASGTGKEGIARFVHRASGRGGPFVAVNCATLVGDVANASLFGHTRGAFTGAVAERQGLFRAAERGTLFLDEVGELGLDIQARLLRALEQREIVPVGTDVVRPVDVLVVAATNADLQSDLDDGGFRGDLFARLSGITVRLPALAERREDILLLARHFARRALGPERPDRPEPALFTADAAERMLLHGWPFNVRELRQLVLRLMLVAPLPFELSALGLPPGNPKALMGPASAERQTAPGAPAQRLRQRPSKDELLRALEAHEHNLSAVARAFGRDRRQVYRWLEQYGIGHDEPE